MKNTNENKRLSLKMKCSDCLHFKCVRSPAYSDVCSALGVKTFATACPSFTPESSHLTKIDESALISLAELAVAADPKQLRLLSYTLRNMTLIERLGFKFGQRVFFNLSSPKLEYVECYYSGYIVAAAEFDDYVYIRSSLDGNAKAAVLLPVESVYAQQEWDRRLKALIKRDLISIPVSKIESKLRMIAHESTVEVDEDYEVPTLDSAPQEWIASYNEDQDSSSYVDEVNNEEDSEELEVIATTKVSRFSL